MSDKKDGGTLSQIVVAVAIALLVGGTSPWWWQEFLGKNGKNDTEGANQSGQDNGFKEQLKREREAKEKAEQELQNLKAEREKAEREIRDKLGKLDQSTTQLLDQVQQSKASQKTNGVVGVTKLTWVDIPQTGFVIMNGSYGILRTSLQAPTGNIEVIDQDLNFVTDQYGTFLVGSNARYAGTTVLNPGYAPDWFRLQFNQMTRLYYIDSVCDTRRVCSRILTEAIF